MAAIAWLGQQAGLDLLRVKTGHELDAVLSAWATRQGLLNETTSACNRIGIDLIRTEFG
jgi:hypothetical protein